VNPLPVPNEVKDKHAVSSPSVYEKEAVYRKKYEAERDQRTRLEEKQQQLQAQLQEERNKLGLATADQGGKNGAGLAPAPLKAETPVAVKKAARPAAKVRRPGRKAVVLPGPPAPTTAVPPRPVPVPLVTDYVPLAEPIVLTVSVATADAVGGRRETAVPLGSYVKAKVLTGVEANTRDAYPMLVQLDYAFVGPNKTRVDLSHCFMIAKTKANLSTERVMGETQDISCVRESGEVVQRSAKGYVAGEDSTFGAPGQLISHQGQVLLAAVLAQLARGAGEAVAATQTTTQIATGGVGGVASSTNITGDKLAYIAGKSVSEPASLIANWYLDYAKQLVPSVALGSGRDVWVVLLETIKVPPLAGDDEGGY
jgi:conjugal transfer pilus assembly protein TraB